MVKSETLFSILKKFHLQLLSKVTCPFQFKGLTFIVYVRE